MADRTSTSSARRKGAPAAVVAPGKPWKDLTPEERIQIREAIKAKLLAQMD